MGASRKKRQLQNTAAPRWRVNHMCLQGFELGLKSLAAAFLSMNHDPGLLRYCEFFMSMKLAKLVSNAKLVEHSMCWRIK